jgi:hypothetical protein
MRPGLPGDRPGDHQVFCPYCEILARFSKTSAGVYGGRDYGPIYFCMPCGAWVGCHKDTERPLGRLANAELRKAKQAAHAAFDPIWQFKEKTRRQAYAWLAAQLGIPAYKCHIGMFDVELCEKTAKISRQLNLNTSPPA